MPDAAAVESFEQLTELIRRSFGEISPQFRAAAQFLLDHPDEVAVSSMRTIATRADVQPSTLVRLAQSLGFAGWPDIRKLFVSRLRSRPDPYAVKAKALVRREATSELVGELFRANRLNLDTTEAQSGPELVRAAQLLSRARTVHVAGFRACYPIAFAFLYGYRLFRPSVRLLSGEGGTLEMNLRAIERDDALLVISFAPYSREAHRVAQAAREKGAKIIALTDSVVAPIALVADQHLLFSVSSPSFFPSQVGAIAAAESLLAMLVQRGGEQAVQQIEAAERDLYASGAYEQPSSSASRPSLPPRDGRAQRAKSRR
jgi:DNA-binding MurR/RpiR family transcriptional regulator